MKCCRACIRAGATKQDVNPRQRNRKGATSNVHCCLLSTLLVFATMILPSTQQQHNISVTKLDETKPVYFDKIANIHTIQDEWKIVVYYNLTTYKQSLQNIESYVKHLSSQCTSEAAFITITSQLQHEINELKHNDNLLQSTHESRKRRGLINGVGYLAHSLFGVLDERFAAKYKHDIRLLQQNENHLKNLYKQQTSIIEGGYNLLKRNEEVMNKQYLLINNHLNDLQTKQVRLEITERNTMYITSGTLAATVIISNLHRIQAALIDMITDLRNGKVDIHLLRPAELLKQLRIITSQLPSDMSLPNFSNEQNVRNIYKILRVHSRLTENFLVFEVKMPLLNNDEYELYRTIPIPQRKGLNSVTVIPTSEYVAINLRKDMFITMFSTQLQTCLIIDEVHLLCPLRQPIYNLKGTETICEAQIINNDNMTQCKTEITMCGDKWVQLHNNGGAWLFSCCQECAVRIFCTAGVTVKSLQGAGLITLGQGCLLKHDTFTIPAHFSYQSTLIKGSEEQMKMIVPQLPEINNLINNASFRIITPESHAGTFNELRKKIDNVKKQQEDIASDETVSFHDIHQYALIYITMSVALAILTYRGARKIKERWFRAQRDQKKHTSEIDSQSVEMQTVNVNADCNLASVPTSTGSAKPRGAKVDAATSPTMTRDTCRL